MSAERWIEIGDCAIIKTEDLIQLPGDARIFGREKGKSSG